jgi:hypothetical protein
MLRPTDRGISQSSRTVRAWTGVHGHQCHSPPDHQVLRQRDDIAAAGEHERRGPARMLGKRVHAAARWIVNPSTSRESWSSDMRFFQSTTTQR